MQANFGTPTDLAAQATFETRVTEANSQSLGNTVLFGCIVSAVLGLASVNPWVTAFGCLVPAVLWKLLWRTGHPAVLMFAAMFQWAQAFTPVIAANMEGRTLQEVFLGPELEQAAWLSLLSVLALATGVWLVKRTFAKEVSPGILRSQAKHLSTKRLFVAYFIASAASVVCIYISSRAGGLRQPILAFAALKWYPVFLLAWTTLQHRKNSVPLMFVVGVEIVLGFTGYFSTFKSVLFLLLVVGMGTAVDRSRIRLAPIFVSILFAFLLVAFWQTVKTEYRQFLNEGSGQQVVVVPVSERLSFLAEASLRTTPSSLWEGAYSGVLRLGYIQFFAHSIENVPSRIPHENGALWFGAVKHTFMPRILFPGKATLNESQRTNKYTLQRVAGEEQGTSISIGFPGESYIDFGPIWMFVPIFFLGAFFGVIYEKLSNWQPYYLSGAALATALLIFSAHQMEMSNIKLVGGVTTGLIAFSLFQAFVVPRLWRLLCEPNSLQPNQLFRRA